MSGDIKRVLEVNQIDNLQGSTQRVKQETTLNNLRGITQRVYVVGGGGEPINNQDKTITANGSYTADEGYTGLGTVTVNVPNPSTGTMYIISNGTYNVADKAIANVNVPSGGTKYNATVECFLGDVDANGVLQNATTATNLVFTGVKSISSVTSSMGVLFRRFQNLQSLRNVSFPDLEAVTAPYAANNAFRGTSITSLEIQNPFTISGNFSFSALCYGCTALTTVDISGLQTVSNEESCSYMFSGCTALTSADISGLQTISGNRSFYSVFSGCTALTTLDLSGLTTINGTGSAGSMLDSICYGCTSLTTVDISGLQTINSYSAFLNAFSGCTALQNLSFTSLSKITNAAQPFSYMCRNCTSLQHLYFPALKSDSFAGNSCLDATILIGVNGCTIHFPSNLDPQGGSTVISSQTGYPNFGGTNTVLAFDLPATE